jgi:hypothetical protein
MNWRYVNNSNEKYEVSDTGLVRSKLKSCKTLSQKTKTNGYKEVNLYFKPNVSKMCYVHRIVVESFIGEIPLGFEINHIDGDKSNNNLSNLQIVTPSENRVHCHHVLGKKIKVYKGSEHGMAKTSEDVVLMLRDGHKNGETPTDLALKHGIKRSTVCKIVYRETWKHI